MDANGGMKGFSVRERVSTRFKVDGLRFTEDKSTVSGSSSRRRSVTTAYQPTGFQLITVRIVAEGGSGPKIDQIRIELRW